MQNTGDSDMEELVACGNEELLDAACRHHHLRGNVQATYSPLAIIMRLKWREMTAFKTNLEMYPEIKPGNPSYLAQIETKCYFEGLPRAPFVHELSDSVSDGPDL